MTTNNLFEKRVIQGKSNGYLNSFFLLKLLYVYQGIVSSRPIEMGNLEFLECMLEASKNIALNLEVSCIKNSDLSVKLTPLFRLINRQTISNSKKISSEILMEISGLLKGSFRKRPDSKIYLQTSLPAVPLTYKSIYVIFGPGLGLGDQITFFSFLNNMSLHCPDSKIYIYTLYPGLWRTLLPKAKEIQYRDKPLRPFYKLASSGVVAEKSQELVIMADFDNFNLHEDLANIIDRDVLEIALGKDCAWFNQYDCPWIKLEVLSSHHTVGKNYWILSKLADRLFPSAQNHSAWQPVVKRPVLKRKSGKIVIFLNPFTSKKYELQVEDWHFLLSLVDEKLKAEKDWDVIVFPGLNSQSRGFASRLVKLCQNGSPRIPARILQSPERKFPTVYNTFDYLSKELQNSCICITVDTFTGHLLPLYGITTLVVTDRDNKAFWVPGRWSYYCLLERMKIALPLLLSNLLIAEKQASLFNRDTKAIIDELTEITAIAIHQGIDYTGMIEVQRLLFNVLNQLPDTFPYKDQGNRWLVRWGQLVWAMMKDPIPSEATIAYVQAWQQSEFFKFITIVKDY